MRLLLDTHILVWALMEDLSRSEKAPIHNDPFDKIMIAQAKTDNLFFVTHDSLIKYYDEPCILFV